METFMAETEESTDSAGHKKSKLKSLKLRLFGKSKKREETSRKLSQSAGDITAAEELGSDEDLMSNPGAMGSRALSHDSIFFADQTLIEAEPTRVLSQENVHVKIKALQEKLQQQKFHLGPPPTVSPSKLSEDCTSHSEQEHVDNQLVMSERHTTIQENFNKALSQMSSNPMLPTPKPVSAKPSSNALSPIEMAPLDFSSSVQFTPVLDTSAARHRLAVKPRNQRASSKRKHNTADPKALTSELINSDTLKEQKESPDIEEESERETVNTKMEDTTLMLPEPTKPVTPSKPSSIVSPQKDISILAEIPSVSTQILRPKAHRPVDVTPRPHSSFISSEVKDMSDTSGNFDIQFLRNTQNKTIDRTSAIKRPHPGSGSFHLSASKRREEEERPRSGSFTGIREHSWIKSGEKRLDTSSNISPKVDLKPVGPTLLMGREETWMTKNCLKKVESVRQPEKETIEGEAKTTFDVSAAPSTASVPAKQTVPAPINTPLVSVEAQPSKSHATSTEVSWMSMAMEKTRGLQNLFSSKFPKDFTGVQKTQGSTPNLAQTETQSQDAKFTNPPLTNAAKTDEHKSPAQIVKQFPGATAQQNMPVSSFKEERITKPVLQPISTEPVTHSVTQGNIWTSQSPLRSIRQEESTLQSTTGLSGPQSSPQPPPWSTRSLRATGLAVTQDITADSKTSTSNVEEKEGQSLWGTAVGKKAAVLEKRAEWTSSPVALQSEPIVSKETESKHTVSTPKKIPERLKEEKWIRKTADPSSVPSPSSTLQSMSDSGELSWIELAKRKSMAWSDKTMD
ncbi:hypothetical protein WMY93_028598 [Mugilogobius chulae]|uniref:DUF4592 domain-containing protein n=1 Tax=Mugilogobius chulae TaxID=88201 RepID=A0AAW0MXX4_9GOBI